MSKINLYNFEAYFLDYSEGNLNAEQMQELRLFLVEHPELENDLLDFENIQLPKPVKDFSYTDKSRLRRDEHYGLTRTEMLLIGKIENSLTHDEEFELNHALAKPAVQKELDFYQKTILIENKSILFAGKAGLKKHKKTIWIKYAAAAVSISLGLFWFSSLQQNNFYQEMENVGKQSTIHEKESKQDIEPSTTREIEKIQPSATQMAELTKKQEAKPTTAAPSQTMELEAVKSKAWKKLPIKLNMAPIEKRHTKLPIQNTNTETKPIDSEFASIPDFLKTKINTGIFKNTVKIELPDDTEKKGFAFSFGDFELSHSSN